MIKILIQGILFGLAYVAPIGTQNLYLINTATEKSKLETFKVVLITTFFDISLAIACFWGIGFLIDRFLILKGILLVCGAILVGYIGIKLIGSTTQIQNNKVDDSTLAKIIATCFVVTWLNPQAIIDGSLLLGGFRITLPSDKIQYFIIGVCTASFIWFNALATLVLVFRSKFIKCIKWINIVCGTVLVFYGGKLAYSFFQLIGAN